MDTTGLTKPPASRVSATTAPKPATVPQVTSRVTVPVSSVSGFCHFHSADLLHLHVYALSTQNLYLKTKTKMQGKAAVSLLLEEVNKSCIIYPRM